MALELIPKLVIKFMDGYNIVTIKKFWVIQKLKEYKILVGDTNTFKTTFLAD